MRILAVAKALLRRRHGRLGHVHPVPLPEDPGRFTHMPEHVALRDTIASHPASPPPDPEGGRDPERDFFLRYGE